MARLRSIARLGNLERAVMEHLWATAAEPDGTPQSVRDVLEGLSVKRNIAYTTVMTVLDRLTKKGFVTRELHGRAWRYQPIKSSEELTAKLLRDGLDHLDSSDRKAALLHFLDGASRDEISDLKAALAQLEAHTPPSEAPLTRHRKQA